MARYTTNFFEADPSTISNVYNLPRFRPSRFTPSLQLLAHNPPDKIRKILDIQSREIYHRLNSSPAQNMVDIFYQSGKTWHEFVSSSKMNILHDKNFRTFDVLFNYLYSFEHAVFHSFSTYFSFKPYIKFKGNANKIIEAQHQIYNMLQKRLQMKGNTCLQVDVRIQLHSITPNIIFEEDDDVDDSDDDPEAIEYDSLPQTYNNKAPKSETTHHNSATFNLNDYYNKIGRIIQDYFNTISPLNIQKAFSYKQMEILLNENNVTICTTNSNVPKEAIQYNHSVNMILNSVNSLRNLTNTLTFSYIVYYNWIRVYAYITNEENRSFGGRIFAKDLIQTIPRLFQVDYVDIDIENNVKHQLQFKPDKAYDTYKEALVLKQEVK